MSDTEDTSEEGSEPCDGEDEQRLIKVESLAGVVQVRDDNGDLEEMEEMAERLHKEAEEATTRLQDSDPKREVQ